MTDQTASASTAAAPSAPTGLRSSGRTRVKTQRALESEHLDRLLSQAKSRESGSATGQSATPETSTTSARTKKKAFKAKKTGKKENVLYCICKTDGKDGRPMIECEHCNDWFHFDCLNLSEDEAERIQQYVCAECEQRTGEKTTHIYDIATFPSPTPPPGAEAQRKVKRKPTTSKPKPRGSPFPGSEGSSSSDDSGSEADDVSHASSSSGSEHGASSPKPRKRARVAGIQSKSRPESSDRKPSVGATPIRKPSGALPTSAGRTTGALPPARAHVLKKMTEVVQGLFESRMSVDKAGEYARELEAALWSGYKEIVNGKEAVGGRYKAQFNLLSSSLSKSLRPEIRSSILDHNLTPAQVATLTSLDLASEAQLREMEAAKQAVLEQTVKSRDDQTSAIRLGRDGLERAEDMREKEMAAIRAFEQVERDKDRRRESLLSQPDQPDLREGQEPLQPPPDSPAKALHDGNDRGIPPPLPVVPRRSESVDVRPTSTTQSPSNPQRRDFGLQSAWGKAEAGGAGTGTGVDQSDVEMAFGNADQDQILDFSDIVVDETNDGLDGLDELLSPPKAEVVESSGPREMEKFESRPVVWTGGLVNPANASPHTPPIHIRHISSRPQPPSWSTLLPRNPIEITGRVPVPTSIKYLSDSRLSPTKELVVVALSLDSNATDDEIITWEGIVDFHIGRDRHGVYLPYGNEPLPPGAAKELYLIPLRPTDPSPEFTELIDGYDLPSTGRGSMFLGVFIMNRESTPVPSVSSLPTVSAPPPPNVPIVPPILPNAQLQALMASLNPQSLQSVLSANSVPIPSPPQHVLSPIAPQLNQTPLGGDYTPPPTGYGYPPQPVPPPNQGYPAYPSYPSNEGHGQYPGPPLPPTHGQGPPYAHGGDGAWRAPPRDGRDGRDRDRSPDRRGRGGGPRRGDFDRSRPSDNGWGRRPRGGGGGGQQH